MGATEFDKPLDHDLDELNSNLTAKLTTLKFYLTKVGKSLTGTVETDSFTCTRTGLYLVRFEINHIGANAVSSSLPYWRVTLFDSNNSDQYPVDSVRSANVIPIAKTWDYSVFASNLYYLYQGTTYKCKFTNETGTATDGGYNSTLRAVCVWLKDIP